MEFVLPILVLLTACGVFVVGIHTLSTGVQGCCKRIESRLRKLFIVKNRMHGALNGAFYSMITQSSSATTVTVIDLVEAGIISLFQAAALVVGANIGTTVTGLIVSLSSFSITPILAFICFIGSIPMLSKNNKTKNIGEIIGGFGLLFVGLDLLEKSMLDPTIHEGAIQVFLFFDHPVLLVLIGAIFTAIIQSSSASSAIAIFMAGTGMIPLQNVFYILIGANIGTCITAILSCRGGKTNSKRVAFIHLFYNIFGAIIFSLILVFFQSYVLEFFTCIGINIQFSAALFHIFFNLGTAILILPILKPITKLSIALIKGERKIYVIRS